VEQHVAGRSVEEIYREYKISKTAIRNWIREMGKSEKFGKEENRTEEEKEMQR
jgi:Mor family transcriptional regulator